jgi:rRNA maturation protein Nop10
MHHILRCTSCGQYALSEKCTCGGTALPPHPARYVPRASYAPQRRTARRQELIKKGLLEAD